MLLTSARLMRFSTVCSMLVRNPHTCGWQGFEKCLTRAFNAYAKREGRIVHSDSMKIRMLIYRIKSDLLTPTKAQLEIELSRTSMMMTYDQALALFRSMVNQKHSIE